MFPVGAGYLSNGEIRIGAGEIDGMLTIGGQTILDATGVAVIDFTLAPK